jgi:hypothetical protein
LGTSRDRLGTRTPVPDAQSHWFEAGRQWLAWWGVPRGGVFRVKADHPRSRGAPSQEPACCLVNGGPTCRHDSLIKVRCLAQVVLADKLDGLGAAGVAAVGTSVGSAGPEKSGPNVKTTKPRKKASIAALAMRTSRPGMACLPAQEGGPQVWLRSRQRALRHAVGGRSAHRTTLDSRHECAVSAACADAPIRQGMVGCSDPTAA